MSRSETPEGFQLLLVESRNLRPFDTVRGSTAGYRDAAGKKRLEALVNDRLKKVRVYVAEPFGTWDGRQVQPR